MSFEIPVLDISLDASTDLSAKQFFFIETSSSSEAALSGAGEVVTGVLQNKPDAAGKSASVRVYGVSKVTAGAAITAGAEVSSDANGKAATSTTGDYIVGIALEAAAADGDIIAVLITHAGISD